MLIASGEVQAQRTDMSTGKRHSSSYQGAERRATRAIQHTLEKLPSDLLLSTRPEVRRRHCDLDRVCALFEIGPISRAPKKSRSPNDSPYLDNRCADPKGHLTE